MCAAMLGSRQMLRLQQHTHDTVSWTNSVVRQSTSAHMSEVHAAVLACLMKNRLCSPYVQNV